LKAAEKMIGPDMHPTDLRKALSILLDIIKVCPPWKIYGDKGEYMERFRARQNWVPAEPAP
jgi:hypothetical protein